MEASKLTIKGYIKRSFIVVTVLSLIALVAFLMVALITTNIGLFINASGVVCLFLMFLFGIYTIRVFENYKSQSKVQCAEGIALIVLTALLVITFILKSIVKATSASFNVDIFLVVFTGAFVCWKGFICFVSFKQKRFNAFLELFILLAFAYKAIDFIVSANLFSSLVCIIALLAYVLTTYVFKTPDYLITAKAEELYKQELEAKNARLAKLNQTNTEVTQPTNTQQKEEINNVETKLKKLDDLLNKNLITKEEYNEKRKEILKEI